MSLKKKKDTIIVSIVKIPEQENLNLIKKIIYKNSKSDLIVFPESIIQTEDLSVVEELKEYVNSNEVIIIIGIIHICDDKKYNYAYFISKEKIDRYQKIHVHWTEDYTPGSEFKIFETEFCSIGPLICFDGAFVESTRVLALKGAKLIIVLQAVPSDFSYKYSLFSARAKAFENQVFVIGSCKGGKGFNGYSVIFDPQGNKITKFFDRFRKVCTIKVNLSKIDKWRNEEMLYPNRKPNLYKLICKNRDG